MALVLMRVAARLPLAMLHAIGVALGWIAYCSPAYRRHLRGNLALAGYEHDARVRRAAIGEAGKMVAEIPKILLGPRDETLALVRAFDGREHIERARAAGKGIVFITPHFGCFEVLAQAIAALCPLTRLYRPPKMSWLEPILLGRAGANLRVARADFTGVRELLAALRRGEGIGVLPDQVPGRGEGVWVEFFGRPAYTMTLAARLAERENAVCLVVTGERLRRGTGFAVRAWPLPDARPGETAERRINRVVEEAVRERPEQYLWGYNRYKQPRGAQPPPAGGTGA